MSRHFNEKLTIVLEYIPTAYIVKQAVNIYNGQKSNSYQQIKGSRSAVSNHQEILNILMVQHSKRLH